MFSDYPDVVTVAQLRKMLGISRHLAYELICEKKIKAFQLGNSYKIPNPVFIRVLHHDVSDDAVFHHSRFNIITHLRHSSKTDPHQSSSSSAGSPSASSTHDGSYLAFFIEVPHDGHILYGLLPTALHPEQIYSSARNRCVRCVQCADFIVLPHIAKASGTG